MKTNITPKKRRTARSSLKFSDIAVKLHDYLDGISKGNGEFSSKDRATGNLVGKTVEITNKNDILRLYTKYFFGKGVYSRGGPRIISNFVKSNAQSNDLSVQSRRTYIRHMNWIKLSNTTDPNLLHNAEIYSDDESLSSCDEVVDAIVKRDGTSWQPPNEQIDTSARIHIEKSFNLKLSSKSFLLQSNKMSYPNINSYEDIPSKWWIRSSDFWEVGLSLPDENNLSGSFLAETTNPASKTDNECGDIEYGKPKLTEWVEDGSFWENNDVSMSEVTNDPEKESAEILQNVELKLSSSKQKSQDEVVLNDFSLWTFEDKLSTQFPKRVLHPMCVTDINLNADSEGITVIHADTDDEWYESSIIEDHKSDPNSKNLQKPMPYKKLSKHDWIPVLKYDGFVHSEPLCLCLEESFFMAFALDSLKVIDSSNNKSLSLFDMWQYFNELSKYKFRPNYIAYHYFRSHNWIPKPGLKFGVDWILYKEGPPYYHSTYSVLAVPICKMCYHSLNTCDSIDAPNNSNGVCKSKLPSHICIGIGRKYHPFNSNIERSRLLRLTENVNKELLIIYVITPNNLTIEQLLTNPNCIRYHTVREQIVRRWIAPQERELERSEIA